MTTQTKAGGPTMQVEKKGTYQKVTMTDDELLKVVLAAIGEKTNGVDWTDRWTSHVYRDKDSRRYTIVFYVYSE